MILPFFIHICNCADKYALISLFIVKMPNQKPKKWRREREGKQIFILKCQFFAVLWHFWYNRHLRNGNMGDTIILTNHKNILFSKCRTIFCCCFCFYSFLWCLILVMITDHFHCICIIQNETQGKHLRQRHTLDSSEMKT